MVKGKKGILPIIGIIVIVVIVLIFVAIYSFFIFAQPSITSASAPVSGCKPKGIAVSIKGSGFSKDIAYIGVVATPERISIDKINAGGIPLSIFGRGITTQDYTWTAKLYDDFTGNLIAQDGGSNNHPGGAALVEDKFSLNFLVPDNNCDGRVDDFAGKIVYTVRTEDGQEQNVDKKINFVNGGFQR